MESSGSGASEMLLYNVHPVGRLCTLAWTLVFVRAVKLRSLWLCEQDTIDLDGVPYSVLIDSDDIITYNRDLLWPDSLK